MMSVTRRTVLCLAAAIPFASPVSSHSMQDVEQELSNKEEYFQPVDRQAPGFALQDADGRTVSLSDFKGKVVVLHFIYTNCPDFCPLHAEKIAEIQKMINISPMKNEVQFISITTDPKRDHGQVLRDFGENHGLDPVNWTFLTTTPDEPEDTTRNLAGAYGIQFKVTTGGDQMHGVVTNVIDQNGHLRARFHSLRFLSLNLVIFVDELIENYYKLRISRDKPGFWAWVKAWF